MVILLCSRLNNERPKILDPYSWTCNFTYLENGFLQMGLSKDLEMRRLSWIIKVSLKCSH